MNTPREVLNNIIETRRSVQGFLLDAFDVIDHLRPMNEKSQHLVNLLMEHGAAGEVIENLPTIRDAFARNLEYIAGLQKLIYNLSDLEETQIDFIQRSLGSGIFGDEGQSQS